MATPPLSDPAAALVDRRVRALAHLVPILELERDKSMGRTGRDWAPYDVKLLTIVAVDTVAVSDGLTGLPGVPRNQLLDDLARVAARCAPERPPGEHGDVARWVLDRLLNHTAAAVAHEVPYVDVTDSYRQVTLPVRLLFETLADDQETLLVNADPAAVHLLIAALDRNLEDAQVATDAVLQYQLETGRLDDAVGSARQALVISRQYRERLRAFLRSIEQNLRSVDWDQQVEPALEAALSHIQGRVRFERELLGHARSGRLADTDDDTTDQATVQLRRRATEIHRLMTDCLTSHADLQHDLIGARARFRDEQARQTFAPPAPVGAVDLADEVLRPLMAVPADRAIFAADEFLAAFLGPVTPRLLLFGPLADGLVRAPAERDLSIDPVDLDLEDLESEFARFDDRHDAALDSLLATVTGPTRLGDLLAKVDSETDDGQFAYEVSLYLALHALRAFRPDGPIDGEFTTTDDGTRLRTAHIADAPDLTIHPPARPAAQETTDDQLAG